jgi:putative SOS response-associated peptidase YedK
MCGRYRFSERTVARMARSLRVDSLEVSERSNHAPTMAGPVFRSGKPQVELMRWGFNSASAPGRPPHLLINARSETVAQLRSFKQAWQQRRCLVPADWFYEWNQASKPKQPWRFVLEGDEPMVIAGIWSRTLLNDGTAVDAYAVLTTTANDVVAQVHDRMPVILQERDWPVWLDPETKPDTLKPLHRPFEGPMYARPVDIALNKASYQGPIVDVSLPLNEPGGQADLFR